MREDGKAKKTEVPTDPRPALDWINFSPGFYLRPSAVEMHRSGQAGTVSGT
jgi:hypothetical protein